MKKQIQWIEIICVGFLVLVIIDLNVNTRKYGPLENSQKGILNLVIGAILIFLFIRLSKKQGVWRKG